MPCGRPRRRPALPEAFDADRALPSDVKSCKTTQTRVPSFTARSPSLILREAVQCRESREPPRSGARNGRPSAASRRRAAADERGVSPRFAGAAATRTARSFSDRKPPRRSSPPTAAPADASPPARRKREVESPVRLRITRRADGFCGAHSGLRSPQVRHRISTVGDSAPPLMQRRASARGFVLVLPPAWGSSPPDRPLHPPQHPALPIPHSSRTSARATRSVSARRLPIGRLRVTADSGSSACPARSAPAAPRATQRPSRPGSGSPAPPAARARIACRRIRTDAFRASAP